MALGQITLLTETGAVGLADVDVRGHDLWLAAAALNVATGFELKPEGLCLDDLCFPLPQGREHEFTCDGRVNMAAFWHYRGGAVTHSQAGDIWVLGEPSDEQAARIESLEAHDFTLPDASGRMHSLSDYRGRKVLLATWASW